MTLSPGGRLGIYEITAAIGACGMGELFRARDTKLGRDVAIKVLLAAMAQDTERVGRFRREAQILATLNHPNIAAIFGFDQLPAAVDGSRPRSDASVESRSRGSKSPAIGKDVAPAGAQGTRPDAFIVFLVMEFVAGDDLAQRLRGGAVPVDEAIAIAKQIAEALEEAHEKGIVHRDLKPANVKVTPEGKVKVLDFGLARALEVVPGQRCSRLTEVSLAHHVPPRHRSGDDHGHRRLHVARTGPRKGGRQARRHLVVRCRALRNARLYTGETVSDVLAAVLTREPDWKALPAATPPGLSRLLRRCLERDPKRRLHDIADARFDLEDSLLPRSAHESATLKGDGRSLAFFSMPKGSRKGGVYRIRIEGSAPLHLADTGMSAMAGFTFTGHLLFVLETTLFAAALDLDKPVINVSAGGGSVPTFVV